MDEWREVSLSDVIAVNPRESLARHEVAKKVAMEAVMPFTKKISNYEVESYKGGVKFRNGDTIMARITPSLENGKTAFVDLLDEGEIAFGSTEFIVFRAKEGITNSHYIYYLTISPTFRDIAIKSMTGSSGRQRVQTDVLKDYDLLLPPLAEQTAIAAVLSSLDDKIDLLHRQNETLEAMAEALFRQWFIEEAEEDWEEVRLKSLVTISSGKGLKKEFFVSDGLYPILGANGEIGKTNEFLFNEKLIYTGRVGTLGNIFRIENEKVWLSDNTLVIRPKKYFNYIYCLLKISRLQDFNVGSTQPLIRQSDIKEIDFLLPEESLLITFEEHCEVMFDKIRANATQIRTLTQLRDTLLPKLMSGEVRVKM